MTEHERNKENELAVIGPGIHDRDLWGQDGAGIRVLCIECGRRSPTDPDLRWTATVRDGDGATVWLCEPCAIEAGLMAERSQCSASSAARVNPVSAR